MLVGAPLLHTQSAGMRPRYAVYKVCRVCTVCTEKGAATGSVSLRRCVSECVECVRLLGKVTQLSSVVAGVPTRSVVTWTLSRKKKSAAACQQSLANKDTHTQPPIDSYAACCCWIFNSNETFPIWLVVLFVCLFVFFNEMFYLLEHLTRIIQLNPSYEKLLIPIT